MRLGRVEATGGFFLMMAWLNYLDRSFIVPMAAAACAAHELGHFFMIQLLKGEVKRIRLTAVGAEMILGQPLGYWQEGMCALAGPGVNLLLAARTGCCLDCLCIGTALAAGIFLAESRGNITLLLVALWLLTASIRQGFGLQTANIHRPGK